MRTLLFLALSAISVSVHAASSPETPGLMPTPIARPLLEQDPGVTAARAGLEVARREAGILDRSPYEWNTKVSGQRRSLQSGPSYQEWNVGIERTLRLPGKATADRNIGKATVEESEARYGDAIHEAARELLTLWLDWLHADNTYSLAKANGLSAQGNLDAVQKRTRAGDAAKLDVSLAQAELAEQRRLANEAKTQASVTWARLHARFPGFDRQFIAMPTALPIEQNVNYWRERILQQSDELKTAEALLRRATAEADRARANKTPDPTIGAYTASEIGGRERITGISISIPFPGGQRNERAIQAVHGAEVKRQEAERVKRQLEADIDSNVAIAQGTYESMQLAEIGAAAMQDNAKLMQRAYSLGEADLQALLTAQRQATAAAQNSLSSKTAALKGYYLLLIDAHLVWDLDHD